MIMKLDQLNVLFLFCMYKRSLLKNLIKENVNLKIIPSIYILYKFIILVLTDENIFKIT